MECDDALALGKELTEAGLEEYGYLKIQREAEEWGDGCDLHLHTGSHSLPADALSILGERNIGLSCLGERSEVRRYLWLLEPEE